MGMFYIQSLVTFEIVIFIELKSRQADKLNFSQLFARDWF